MKRWVAPLGKQPIFIQPLPSPPPLDPLNPLPQRAKKEEEGRREEAKPSVSFNPRAHPFIACFERPASATHHMSAQYADILEERFSQPKPKTCYPYGIAPQVVQPAEGECPWQQQWLPIGVGIRLRIASEVVLMP